MLNCLQKPVGRKDAFRQCLLKRNVPNGVEEQTSYLPACYAVPGAVLRLKGPDGWEDSWVVCGPVGPLTPGQVVRERSRDHLKAREHSDI